MPSENVSNADNQQERFKLIGWIVGLTDGEGCFSVSVFKNSTTKSGWQVFPEFVVTQSEESKNCLEVLQKYFGCGSIYINRRKDNHRENLYRYCVRNLSDINNKIIPFYQENCLITAKRNDFDNFCKAVDIISKGDHLKRTGFEKIVEITKKMNRKRRV